MLYSSGGNFLDTADVYGDGHSERLISKVLKERREEVHVSAGYDGVLAEWLVHEGDLVDAGDPIARLYPEVSA